MRHRSANPKKITPAILNFISAASANGVCANVLIVIDTHSDHYSGRLQHSADKKALAPLDEVCKIVLIVTHLLMYHPDPPELPGKGSSGGPQVKPDWLQRLAPSHVWPCDDCTLTLESNTGGCPKVCGRAILVFLTTHIISVGLWT